MNMLLEDRNAVVYGAGGSIGGAVARTFARGGARVFLAGRTVATLDEVVERAGNIDISFNAISIQDQRPVPSST
jgi:3-oxoacyl-[acyl-carrier protein] reductase